MKRCLYQKFALLLALLFSATARLPSTSAAALEIDFEQGISALEQTFNALEQGTAYVTTSPTPRAERRGRAKGRENTGGVDAGAVEVGLIVFGRSLRLELQAIDIFAPGAKVVHVTDHGNFEESATANTYRGVVLGASESVVAVSIEAGIPEGLILVDDDFYLIRAASYSDATAAPDELIAWHGSAAKMGLTAFPRATLLNVLEIAAVADFEYFQLHGSNTTAQIASVVNQVNAVYENDIQTSIQILVTMVFETSNDPFSDFNSGNLFNDFRDTTAEFGNWRSAQGGNLTAAGLGHLFSNKFGINAGFGFTNVLCDPSRGASITTTNIPSLHPLLIEHELGHNFGADHDGEAGGSCPSAPAGFIMAPAATGTEFSTCSKAVMSANRDLAVCIMPEDDVLFADGFESG